MGEGIKNEVDKKRGRFSPKITKCISIALLSLILIMFIYLQVPWKVNAIYIATLLSTIFLKKSQEKWVWLILAVVVSVLVIWVFLPDENEGWRPYTFDKELAQMESKRFVPYNENAAVIYNQLLENYDSNSSARELFAPETRDAILKEFWKSRDYPEAAEWIEKNQNIIEQMMRACEKQKCWFPVFGELEVEEMKPQVDIKSVRDYWGGSPSAMEHLRMIRNYSELITASANNDAAEGREGLAIQKFSTVLQISKHLFQQQALIDSTVAMRIGHNGISQINKLVVERDINDIQLSALEQALQNIQYNWQPDVVKFLDYEKLMYKSLICAIYYQTNSKGKIRFSRDPNATLSEFFNPPSAMRNKYWREKRTKAGVILCWFFVPSKPKKTATIIDDIYKKYYAMTEPDFDWKIESEFLSWRTAKMNLRFYLELMPKLWGYVWSSVHDGYLRADASKRASLIIIDLRRYKNKTGHWPESLVEIEPYDKPEILIDPINNDRFVYKLTEEGFKLYSKGKNNIDEDGKKGPIDSDIQKVKGPDIEQEEKAVERDDILIWPPEEK